MNYRKLKSLLLIILLPFFMEAQPISQSQLLLASDGDSDDMFGYSISVSGDFAVFGTPQDDDIAENTGAAYIYAKTGTSWSFSEKIIADDGETADMFGESVDIDGDYLVVGSYQAAVGIAENIGAVYVYKNNGTNWEQVAKIYANDGESADNFGKTVAISGDYIVVGAPNEYYSSGATYIFHKNEETWTQILKIEAEDINETDNLGCSVDIDGDYIVIGALHNNHEGVSNTGAAYVYHNNAGTWELDDKLVASDATNDDGLGFSVAISGDYVIAGAIGVDGSKGAAYIFYRGTPWVEHEIITASDGAGEDYFGKSVSISGDYVLVGSHRHNSAKAEEGAAYLYKRDMLDWNEDRIFTASDASETGLFGYCVAIEDDFAFVSSTQVNGAVYVFGPEGAGTSITEHNEGISIYPNPANNNLTIDFTNINNLSNSRIKIVDITGKTVLEDEINEQKQTINISKLVRGVYFIKIDINGEMITQKIIVR